MNISDWKYTIMSQIETIVIKIQNDDNYCAIRAILTAKMHLDLENGLIVKLLVI